jgi:hypothetical protein
MNVVIYYEMPDGGKPARDWINKQDKPVRVSIYGKKDDLAKEGLALLHTKALDIIQGPDKGLYELRSVSMNWRIGVYHDKAREIFILLHGWHHDANHEKEHNREIDRARSYLREYLKMER